jgi:hypothetical protein
MHIESIIKQVHYKISAIIHCHGPTEGYFFDLVDIRNQHSSFSQWMKA